MQRGMLAQFAASLRARQGGTDGPGGGVILGEDGEAVIVDDNCTVYLPEELVTNEKLTAVKVM